MRSFADAHLDIAWASVHYHRDFVSGHPDSALGLPNLLAGGVTLACATVFVAADEDEEHSPAGAAGAQLAYYEALPERSGGRVVWPADVMDVGTAQPGHKVCLIGLMEGCEPVESPEQMTDYYKRGIRVAGLTWNKRNRWASGCMEESGGITPEGFELVQEIDRLGMIHDVSHLSRRAVDDLLGAAHGRIIASHVGSDAVFNHPRNLTDEHLKGIAKLGGVVGLVFYSGILGEGRATLDDLMRHLMHMLEVCGADHVGLGSDLDGGFGREELPTGIRSAADFPCIADALAERGVDEADVDKICGGNWRRVLTAVM
ncbi:MAG: membrane dipeptidase [Planctomycetota bacterium]|nr:membrane dipeptidase [Planctomycetota bacterium]